MRWPIIRLIWVRELRDQVRDRRTLFTILVLPLLLYPLLGALVKQFATQLLDQTSTIGLVVDQPEEKDFPQPLAAGRGASPVPALSLLSLTPIGPTTPADKIGGALALYWADQRTLDYVPLFVNGEVPEQFRQSPKERLPIFPGKILFEYVFLSPEQADKALVQRKVDLLVSAPADFLTVLIEGGRPPVEIKGRPGDDRSRRALEQFSILLARWKSHLKEVRFHRQGLSGQFDDPFEVRNPQAASSEAVAAASLIDLLVRTFPFMLVMWSLVGALYPAVDLCAGEKERGTMETLLISPAGRGEIVLGKFLTIWVFSAVTAVMHLVSMTMATWQLRSYLPPQAALTLPAIFWCVVLILPLSAFFSAIALAVGAYARSSKEGQYYLMPLFWVTMPLVFLTMVPGVELNSFYSMVPVTGVALLMQDLMRASALDLVQWFYFVPVFATVIVYSWLALRWAVGQFQREEVLFRQAERLDLMLWLRRLFRDKEALPTPGLALFCFFLLVGLRWLSLDLGSGLPLLARTAIIQAAFVLTPPVLMALILTTRPRQGLSLAWPRTAYLAAAFLLLPLAELALFTLQQIPELFKLLSDRRSFVDQALRHFGANAPRDYWMPYFLVLSLLPAVGEELAFRGLILSGLRRRLAPWPAILLSSFLFAAYHMNVFALLPLMIFGIVLGWFAMRSGSLLPGIVLHAGGRMLLLSGPLTAAAPLTLESWSSGTVLMLLLTLALVCAGLAVFLLLRLQRPNEAGMRFAGQFSPGGTDVVSQGRQPLEPERYLTSPAPKGRQTAVPSGLSQENPPEPGADAPD